MTQKDIDTLRDTLAGFEERLVAAEARSAELAGKVDDLFKLLGPWLDQHAAAAKQPLDPQVAFINARVSSQRTQEPTRPVQPAPAFDAQTSRIHGKRRELIGAKK